jgi:Ser/Thr protein kinase RdoA (MazF antagonist)
LDLRLDLWRETENGRATLINLSENHTFRIDAPAGTTVLRLHRPGYQSAAGIESELAWLEALRRDTDLPVVRPLPGRDGHLVQQIGGRHAVLFAFETGGEPTSGTPDLFRTLGAFAAKAHLHVATWNPPSGFSRPTWSAATMLEPDGLWGDWRQAPGVAHLRSTLDAVAAALHDDLAAYGQSSDRFGLIHADMRLANLLVDVPRIVLLDFDDCGFGWFMYDLAAALSFIETGPDVPMLQQAWLDGYTALRPLAEADIAIIPAMILLRRMVLLAWIGTHGETSLAQAHAPHFAANTAVLGEAWLGRR